VIHGSLDAMATTPFRPTIRTQADLEQAWRRLMRPLGFGRRSLWLMLVCDDDRPLPQLTEIADLPELPTGGQRRQFTHFLEGLVGLIDDARFAFLLTRPGPGGPDEVDRAWAAMLYDVARETGTPCEVVHVATDDTVAPIPLDGLDVRSA